MADVVLKDVEKDYAGGIKAVRGANLEIADREFVVLVGPSGCGKSTTLRMIAGLEDISAGTIAIDGKVVNEVAPKDRDIAMVFQNYALYPHMSCFENMAFGLKLRNFPKDEIRKRVTDAAQILGITDLLERKPKELSGGQRQRVAVGRAIVRKPSVFLFDEPLSNLDAKLRVEMRVELHKLHERLATTMVYVTHDQIEAMTLGDRIVIMDKGEIQQIASPLSLYDEPYNRFVASFIGTPAMNFLEGALEAKGDALEFVGVGGEIRVPIAAEMASMVAGYAGKPIVLGIRPEHVHDESTGVGVKAGARLTATVEVVESLGDQKVVYYVQSAHKFIGKLDAHVQVASGKPMGLVFDTSKVHLFEKEHGRNLTCRVARYEAANLANLPQPMASAG